MTSESHNSRIIFSPNSAPYGLTYSVWTEKWLKWLLSIPRPYNPALDSTGVNCGKNQGESNVWFLAGTLGGIANRTCTMSRDKGILLPIIIDIQTFAERPEFTSESQLASLVRSEADKVLELYASIDSREIKELSQRRFFTAPFDVTLPEDNICGVKAGPTRAAADGYWLFIQPLEPAKHSVHIMGRGPSFRTEAIYNLTVGVA